MCRVPIAPAVVALMLAPSFGCGDSQSSNPPPDPGGVDATTDRPDAMLPADSGVALDATSPDAGQPADTGAMAGLCPPMGPFGLNVGAQMPDVTLTDCDGNTRTLHDLCEERAAWMFIFAGW